MYLTKVKYINLAYLSVYCHLTVGVAIEERERATGEEPEQEPILIPAGIILSCTFL